MRPKSNETWRIKAEAAWRTAAQCAVLAQEADETEEREYYIRMRDAWIGLANRCEFLDLPDDQGGDLRPAPAVSDKRL